MRDFVRRLTLALAVLSALSGIFLGSLLSSLEIQIPDGTELRWSLVAGMPTLLLLSFAWLDRQPATTASALALQSLAQLALFSAPYCWVIRHSAGR
ncbi:MAG: hypothetical protein FIA97_17770 [Methylococcaceae bacterium]|nr:hypothetical protein [Methylococcaceae bacterium]